MKLLCLGLLAGLVSTSMVTAQDVSVAQSRPDGSVRFLLLVATKSGASVTDLREQDFTIYDGEVIRPIRSFRTIDTPETHNVRQFVTGVNLANHSEGLSMVASPVAYEIIFDGARSQGRRQFHEVGIRVDRPNLQIVTSSGYLTSALSTK